MVARVTVDIPRGYQLIYDKKQLRAMMRSAGTELAQVTRSLIRTATRKAKGAASQPGEPPHSRTGALARGVKSQVIRSGNGVRVYDPVFYAKFLETGAVGGGGVKGARNVRKRIGGKSVLIKAVGSRVLLPRPFLTRALELREASLSQRVQDAIVKGIAFQRLKA